MVQTIKERTFPQLVATGSTSAVEVANNHKHSFQVKVAALDTSVVFRIKGSMDNTNFFTVPLTNTAVAGLAHTANLATVTIDGTYLVQAEAKVNYIALDWTTENSGTTATLDVRYLGGN